MIALFYREGTQKYREFTEHSQGHTGKFLHLVGCHFHGPEVSYGYSDYLRQVIFLSVGRDSATEWLKGVAGALTHLQGKMDHALTSSMALANICTRFEPEVLHL